MGSVRPVYVMCPVKSRRRAFQSMSINFCGRYAAAFDSVAMDYT